MKEKFYLRESAENVVYEKDNIFKEQKTQEKEQYFRNNNHFLKERAIDNLHESYSEKYSIKAFSDFLLETYMSSLVVDSEFINENNLQIRNYFLSKLNERCGNDPYAYMNDVAKINKPLNELVEACKKAGISKAKRVRTKCNEEENISMIEDEFKKALNDDDVDFDTMIDKEDASELIKNKVVDVIKKEEENNAKKQEIINDINQSNLNKDPEDMSESVQVILKDGLEHHSLFNSMMIYNYKQCINGLNEGVDMGDYVTLNEETHEASVNMNYVLFDTILEYTELELYNTLGIDNYTNSQLREMCDDYAHYRK